MMRGFSINLEGRVKNFSLPKNQSLIPLYEAIVNSLHAIEDRKELDVGFRGGQITIELEREPLLDMGEMMNPGIESFFIKDNGIGFDERNFSSFLESDSTYKAEKGGKGVGRFSWLVAFERAEIESTYFDTATGDYVRRSFSFTTDRQEINDTLEEAPAKDNLTVVKLCNCYDAYRKFMPKTAETIAQRIIQHCLVYFISDDCPRIRLIDNGESYDLNAIFQEKIKTDNNVVKFDFCGESFELLHVKAEENSIGGNKLYFCANNRLVETKALEKHIIDLDRQIYDKENFWYIGVLTGAYLDKNVDMNRLSFNISNTGNPDNEESISMDLITRFALREIETYLKPYLIPIREDKIKKIKEFITTDAPQFRHLLKYKAEAITQIKPNLSGERLDDELYAIKREFEKEVKKENKTLLDELNNGYHLYEDYEDLFRQQMEKVTSANSSALADYVTHRKVIIDLLELGIKKKDNGKFQKEKFIHDLIYPMRSTSEDSPYDNHNLWLIDEKLAYCRYISSDVPFDNNPKEPRTDIMILDKPVAVSENRNDGSEFDTIILFELKKPMRNDYGESENPITQLYDYVDKIKSGTAKDKDGRPIKAGENTKFYLYVICDITPKITRFIMHDGFNPTPDKMGFYRYNDNYRAYFEILPFDKMIKDSKKRNQILFEKLGIK